MIKISKKVEYALIVLQHLNSSTYNSESPVTARHISKNYSTPFDTTSKVMQLMNNCGILESAQGVKGGYILKSDLSNYSYYQLAELVEEKKLYVDCFEQNCSLLSKCNITKPIIGLNNKVKSYLENLTIKELLG